MNFGTLALLAMALWFAFLWLRAHVRRQRATELPAGVRASDLEPTPFASASYDRVVDSLRAFGTEYKLTFQSGGCTREALLSLHTLRDETLKHLYDMKMRLPNDLDAETQLRQYIEDTDFLLRKYIQDVQTRSGASLTFPGPIDDTFYRQYYRAYNDTTT